MNVWLAVISVATRFYRLSLSKFAISGDTGSFQALENRSWWNLSSKIRQQTRQAAAELKFETSVAGGSLAGRSNLFDEGKIPAAWNNSFNWRLALPPRNKIDTEEEWGQRWNKEKGDQQS